MFHQSSLLHTFYSDYIFPINEADRNNYLFFMVMTVVYQHSQAM